MSFYWETFSSATKLKDVREFLRKKAQQAFDFCQQFWPQTGQLFSQWHAFEDNQQSYWKCHTIFSCFSFWRNVFCCFKSFPKGVDTWWYEMQKNTVVEMAVADLSSGNLQFRFPIVNIEPPQTEWLSSGRSVIFHTFLLLLLRKFRAIRK